MLRVKGLVGAERRNRDMRALRRNAADVAREHAEVASANGQLLDCNQRRFGSLSVTERQAFDHASREREVGSMKAATGDRAVAGLCQILHDRSASERPNCVPQQEAEAQQDSPGANRDFRFAGNAGLRTLTLFLRFGLSRGRGRHRTWSPECGFRLLWEKVAV